MIIAMWRRSLVGLERERESDLSQVNAVTRSDKDAQ